MNTTRTLILALLAAAAAGRLFAQDPPANGAAPAAPQSEMQKWIATTDAQWQEAFKKGVTDVHEAELNQVKLQYLTLLEDGIGKASKASNLKDAVALRDEQRRFGDTQSFPEQDDAADPAAVKQIRAVIRAQLAKVNNDRAARAKGLHAKYDQMLAQTQVQLTQKQRLDDALLVQAKRDEVTAAWGASAGAITAQPAQPTAARPASPPKTVGMSPAASTKGTAKELGVLFGTWRFTNIKNGWNQARIFKADGSFMFGPDSSEKGKWEATKDKIVLTYPRGNTEEMDVPPNPGGTTVVGGGRTYNAVKEK